MIEQALTMEAARTRRLALRYLLYLPSDYEARSGDRFPLILFLHGSGERGDDLDSVKRYGLPQRLRTWSDCPFIVVAPQCPLDSVWVYHLDALNALLDAVIAAYRVDTTRVYLTGLSLGGTGTWFTAGAYPSRFAAIAPICGHNTGTSHCELFKQLPVWIFHGAKDDVIPVAESQSMEASLKRLGADVRLTIYPDAGHDSWTQAYNDPDLYTWFLEHPLA